MPGTRITPEAPAVKRPVPLRITLPVPEGPTGVPEGGIGTSRPPTYIKPPSKSPPAGPPVALNPAGAGPAKVTAAPARARTPPVARVLVMPVKEMLVPADRKSVV